MSGKIILVTAKEHTVLRGHPWIFPKAISRTTGLLITGQLVEVYNEQNQCIAVGAYNEHSLYRVRVLALATESFDSSSYQSILTHRLQQAYQLRRSINLPNEGTTAYRLFNSEADGLSGLTIDYFNDVVVVASSAYWVEANRELLLVILTKLHPKVDIIWFPQVNALKQDGWKDPVSSEVKIETDILEGGVRLHVAFENAQKTGLFLDQRENHQRLAALSKGKKVLDLYTYHGGFALHAAHAGARQVTAVDSSAAAIRQAEYNAQLNGLTNIDFIVADARDYLSHAGQYDVVVLDPPKLAPSRKHVQQAKNYYRFLHREVFKHMMPGSLLMTCNCSSALSSQEFSALVGSQASAVGKQARILGVYGPASCHPTVSAFPEGDYLTALLVAVV